MSPTSECILYIIASTTYFLFLTNLDKGVDTSMNRQPYIRELDIPISYLKVARDELRYRPIDHVRTQEMVDHWFDCFYRPAPAVVVFDDTVVYDNPDDARYHRQISTNPALMSHSVYSPCPSPIVSFEVADGAHCVLAAAIRQESVQAQMRKRCVVYRLSDISDDIPSFLNDIRQVNHETILWMGAVAQEQLWFRAGYNPN